MVNAKKIFSLATCITLLVTSTSFSQAVTGTARLEPVFPDTPAGLIWIEAEDAVNTNFAGESTLDYGSSAYRRLTLNKEGQSPSAPFYAEYAVVIDEAGTWQFWVGGTPPGPENELLASFVSPFRLIVDGGDPLVLYREQVSVNERYSTTNYWFAAKAALELSAGVHTFRFEIQQTRRYDSRFYFFLDAFFLLRPDSPLNTAVLDRAIVPEKFPMDLRDTSIDSSYLSIPEYEYSIQNSPKKPDGYLLLAQVYSLIGDNGSALKTLARGRVVAGDDIRFILQSAKSRIASGEIDEGLRLYGEYLSSPDAEKSVWSEAAKLSAWLMKYQEAENLYTKAIALYPDDIDLKVNYALTLLWEGKVKQGEKYLLELWKTLQNDPEKIESLGQTYLVSGYPDKAISTWADGAKLFPDRLALYFRLADAYQRTNQPALAQETLQKLNELFIESPRLTGILAAAELKSSLKSMSIQNYLERLSENPDDLALRQELVRAYYWNGMLAEALAESNNILANKLYAIFNELDTDLEETYRLIDLLSLLKEPVHQISGQAAASRTALMKAVDTLKKAEAKNTQALAGKDIKKQEKAAAELLASQDALAASLATALQSLAKANTLLPRIENLTSQVEMEGGYLSEDSEMLANLEPWKWDISSELTFLASVSQVNPLAYHCASRIQLLEGKTAAALPEYELLQKTKELQIQSVLWTRGSIDGTSFDSSSYFPHGSELAETIASLSAGEVELRSFDEWTVGEAQEMMAHLDEVSQIATQQYESARNSISALIRRARTRMRIRAYQYDTETQQDRRELADVYLRLDQPDSAVQALARVLAVSPSDSASMFTIGRAKEMSGDWHGAMKEYLAVYGQNPRYENAVSSYNRLAGMHASSIKAQTASSIDTTTSYSTAQIDFETPIGSVFSVQGTYSIDHKKLHTPQAGAFPESVTLHTFDITLPVHLAGIGLSVYGKAGATLQNKLENLLPAKVSLLVTETLSEYFVVAPRLGAGITYTHDYTRQSNTVGRLSIGGQYRFNQLDTTFYNGRLPFYTHEGGLNASYYQDSQARSFARTLSARVAGNLSSIYSVLDDTTDNLLTSLDAETHLGSSLASDPQITLDLGLALAWRDSTEPGASDYYAPLKVITVKGGPAATILFGPEASTGVSIMARVWPGYYTSDGIGRLSMDGNLSFGLVRHGLNLFLNLGGAYTGTTDTSAAWWSGTANIGLNIALGDYLIP